MSSSVILKNTLSLHSLLEEWQSSQFSIMDSQIPNLKFLTVDDNSYFLDLLTTLLQGMGAKHIRRASSAKEALQLFRKYQPDICLIDIELSPSKKDGGDLAFQIRKANSDVPIIFITSYFQQSFYDYVKPVKPVGFMNKDISELKLLQVIELAADIIEKNKGKSKKALTTPADASLLTTPHNFAIGHIFFKVGDVYKPIEVSDIDFFFADNKLTCARVNGRNYPTYVQLKVLTAELAPLFLRCHNKYLVNVNRIESIQLSEGNIKIGGQVLNIGYAYRKSFLNEINLLK